MLYIGVHPVVNEMVTAEHHADKLCLLGRKRCWQYQNTVPIGVTLVISEVDNYKIRNINRCLVIGKGN